MNRSSRKDRALHRQGSRVAALNELVDALRSIKSDKKLPPFGSLMGQLSGMDATDTVIMHRIISKYEPPGTNCSVERRERTILEALSNDNASYVERTELYNLAHLRLRHWFRGFRKTYVFRAPSGASALVDNETDDVFTKLRNPASWEVSPENFDYASKIAYNNSALKRIVKKRFREDYPYLHMCELFRKKHGTNPFKCFQEQFKALVHYNSVVRLTTVPKNNDTDRMISCIPLWDMICQLSYMEDMRSHVKSTLGYDLTTRADLHKVLISDKTLATIDLKSASDLMSNSLVKRIWPSFMLKDLQSLRPKVASYNIGKLEEYHHFNMFAPMGSGITFDVMTFTILALIRDDPSASVFGDDIIVKKEFAQQTMRNLQDAGFRVNDSKSFVDGYFRESCGGMYHDHTGYITSYDIKCPKDTIDSINIVNKFWEILKAKQCSAEVLACIGRCRDALIHSLPNVVYGCEDTSLNSSHVYVAEANVTLTDYEREQGAYVQRLCRFHTAYTRTTRQLPFIGDVFDFARVLYGGGNANSKESLVTSRSVDTWSASAIRTSVQKVA